MNVTGSCVEGNTMECDFNLMLYCRSELDTRHIVKLLSCTCYLFQTKYSFTHFLPCFVRLSYLIYASTLLECKMFWICRHYSLIAFIFTLWAFMENWASFFFEYFFITGFKYFWRNILIVEISTEAFSFRERIFNAQLLKHRWMKEETVTPRRNDRTRQWWIWKITMKGMRELEVFNSPTQRSSWLVLEDS